MATLNNIITQLADSLNRPFDEMFKSRLKELVIQEFALYVSRSITKYGVDKEFVYSYYINELEEITTLNNRVLVRPYYQTVNKIPRPLRYEGDVPFIYVGTVDGDMPFSYRNIHSRKYTSLVPNVGAAPSYDFHEDRLRLWNTPLEIAELATNEHPIIYGPITNILVQEVPSDPRANSYPDLLDQWFLNDDREFPVTQDFIQQIKLSLLKGELSVTDSKDKVEATHLDNN